MVRTPCLAPDPEPCLCRAHRLSRDSPSCWIRYSATLPPAAVIRAVACSRVMDGRTPVMARVIPSSGLLVGSGAGRSVRICTPRDRSLAIISRFVLRLRKVTILAAMTGPDALNLGELSLELHQRIDGARNVSPEPELPVIQPRECPARRVRARMGACGIHPARPAGSWPASRQSPRAGASARGRGRTGPRHRERGRRSGCSATDPQPPMSMASREAVLDPPNALRRAYRVYAIHGHARLRAAGLPARRARLGYGDHSLLAVRSSTVG